MFLVLSFLVKRVHGRQADGIQRRGDHGFSAAGAGYIEGLIDLQRTLDLRKLGIYPPRVKGQAMLERGIRDGDIFRIQRRRQRPGGLLNPPAPPGGKGGRMEQGSVRKRSPQTGTSSPGSNLQSTSCLGPLRRGSTSRPVPSFAIRERSYVMSYLT